jgi:hypothetical protein
MAAANWRTVRAIDVVPVIHCPPVIARFGGAATLGEIDEVPERDWSPESGPKRERWVGVLLNAISQAKMRWPDRTHRDLPQMPRIDYGVLGEAFDLFVAWDYTPVEAPWAVSEESVAITCPNPQFTARVEGLGSLVGSAEQSFLHLDLAGKLGKGRFVAVTPCFRLGDAEDDLHFPCFMKVELYDNTGEQGGWKALLADAWECARILGAPEDRLAQEATEEGRDITLGGIEIGSFGRRARPDLGLDWQYGTGLALPRFTQALDRVL